MENSQEQFLRNLVVDLDYQQHYDYEKRVDLFNKYGISTSEKFFVPIWYLAQFVGQQVGIGSANISQSSIYNKDTTYRLGYNNFSHGQRVLNLTLVEQCEKAAQDKNNEIEKWQKRIKLFKHRVDISMYYYNLEEPRLRPTMSFSKDGVVSFKTHNPVSYNDSSAGKIYIPRNLYQLIDDWLIDFGFGKWDLKN